MRRSIFIFIFSLLSLNQLEAQINKNRKIISTKRVQKAPKIDGLLNDDAWKNADIANNFVMYSPDNGKSELANYKTEVKVVYDNDAIYIGATMYDPNPSTIPSEFTNRDNIGQSDYFLANINPNDDGQNGFEFIVLNTGTQVDAKISQGDEDGSWNAVWQSSVKLTGISWVVEMRIPYSALRFSKKKEQNWSFNFQRKIQNLNAQYSWNFIDNSKGSRSQYDGLITGFNNIKSPTRLSFYPYASTTATNYNGKTNYSNSLGLDIKYGITENFTLDATLIPDFGQAAFDNVTLNLGPFEQHFSEQRQFFTEGTELFGKGGLFYSRRIGDRASKSRYTVSSTLGTNEVISDYPNKVQMLNAIKISGRTKNGLGIGFFNAITEETKATIKNTNTGKTRKETIEPFTNYNVLVLDQQFNKNSAVTLINTNVTRIGDEFRDGNVTGLLYRLRTKDSKYYINGDVKMSNVNQNKSTSTGYSFRSSIGKSSGNWGGQLGYQFKDTKFDINDLGFQNSNNNQAIYGSVYYQILKPTKRYNQIEYSLEYNVNFLQKPGIYTGNSFQLDTQYETKNRFSFGGSISGNLGKQYDYFEPRQALQKGIFFLRETQMDVDGWISTDSRKKFAYSVSLYKNFFYNRPKSSYGFNVSPRYRVSDQLSFAYQFRYSKTDNDRGFVDIQAKDIIFGQRDRKSYNNSITGKYSFSIKSSLSLSFRHYWETAAYENQYYKLKTDGNLAPTNYAGTDNINFNSWNIDLNYIWEFAPGSQLIAFYRNTIQPSENFAPADLSFGKNLNRLFQEKSQNTFSLRLVYYIDYAKLKKVL